MLESLFFEIGAIIVLAAVLSFVASALRQPLILAYLVTGMLAGASMLNLVQSFETFEVLSQIGIAFLLFTVGLGLDWRKMKDVGGLALGVGLGQVLLSGALTYPLALALGFPAMTSLFLSVAFAFSSTVIIVKLLADKDDLDSLYGRVSLGILLVQDLIAMVLLLMLGAIGSGETLGTILAVSLVKGLIALLLLLAVSVWIIPHLVRYAAKSQELLLLFSIAWCFLVAGVLTASGFGIEIGALLAGVSLSGTIFHREILSRVRHLRDFFLIIFFIVLGIGLDPTTFGDLLLPALLFSLVIFLSKPVIVLFLVRLFGHHPRTGWLTGSTLGQVSEFSFVVLAVGAAMGLVDRSVLVLAALVGVFTIAASAYVIQYNETLYRWFRPVIHVLEPIRSSPTRRAPKTAEVILLGHHRMGSVILPALLELKKRLLVIDADPAMVVALHRRKIPAVYGDAGDDDFLADMQVHDAALIVSTIPDLSVTTSLLEYLKRAGYRGLVVVTVKHMEMAQHAYELGADDVIVPAMLGGEKFAELIGQRKLVKSRWRKK